MVGVSLSAQLTKRRRLGFEWSTSRHRTPHLESLESRLPLTASIVGGGTYLTIQEAINNAKRNDLIAIKSGIYAESVNLSRMGSANGLPTSGNLTLRGVGGTVTINPVSGKAMRNTGPFSGNLTIANLGFTSPTGSGFVLNGYQGDLRILNSRFNNNVRKRGIELSNATGSISIVNSEIRDMATKGISLNNVENVLIDHVMIDGKGTLNLLGEQDGIYGIAVSGIQILNSEIHDVGKKPADDGIDLTNPNGKYSL